MLRARWDNLKSLEVEGVKKVSWKVIKNLASGCVYKMLEKFQFLSIYPRTKSEFWVNVGWAKKSVTKTHSVPWKRCKEGSEPVETSWPSQCEYSRELFPVFVNQFGRELGEILETRHQEPSYCCTAFQAWYFHVSVCLYASTGIFIGAPWCLRFLLGSLLACYSCLLNGRFFFLCTWSTQSSFPCELGDWNK